MTILALEHYDTYVNSALSIAGRNEKTAFDLLKQAASKQNLKAKFLLIEMKLADSLLITPKPTKKKLADSLLITPKILTSWIEALSLNIPPYKGIYFTLGYIYEFGIIKMDDKHQNIAKSIEYYTRGLFLESKCTERLARCYFLGINVKKSIKTSIMLYDHLIYNEDRYDLALVISKKMDKKSNCFQLLPNQRQYYARLALKYAKRAMLFGVKGSLLYYSVLDAKINKKSKKKDRKILIKDRRLQSPRVKKLLKGVQHS